MNGKTSLPPRQTRKKRTGSPLSLRVLLAKALAMSRFGYLSVSIFCIALTLIFSGILLLALGKNPFVAFYSFLQGNGFARKMSYGNGAGMLSDFFAFLNICAPMLLASLSFIFGYRSGLFNIGISGQMLLSGFLATVFVGYSDLPGILARPLVLLVGMSAGALLGGFVGFLKYRFNIHEVVSTIMINYIISYVTGFYINSKFVNQITRSSNVCASSARLTFTKVEIAGYSCSVPLGIGIAILGALLVQPST